MHAVRGKKELNFNIELNKNKFLKPIEREREQKTYTLI